MSEENVEMVRRLYNAVDRRDTATVLAFYDPDVEFDISRVSWGDITGQGVYHGHKGLRRVFRDWHEAFENYEADLEDLIDADEHVISVGNARARGRASGAEVELTHQAGVWTIRGDKIVRVVWFPTRAEALEAAGLSE